MIASVPMDFCRLSREDLKANEVHVWSACLDLKQQYVDSLENLLSTDEQQRAGRFCFWRDRNRFIVGRGLLRVCLSRYLDREPREIECRYGTQGKPELVAR